MTTYSKVIGCQSSQSKKILDLLGSRLRFCKLYTSELSGPSELGWQVWQLPHQYLRDLLMSAAPILDTNLGDLLLTATPIF